MKNPPSATAVAGWTDENTHRGFVVWATADEPYSAVAQLNGAMPELDIVVLQDCPSRGLDRSASDFLPLPIAMEQPNSGGGANWRHGSIGHDLAAHRALFEVRQELRRYAAKTHSKARSQILKGPISAKWCDEVATRLG